MPLCALVLLLLAFAACNRETAVEDQDENDSQTSSEASVSQPTEAIPLTEEETGILEAMGEDVNVVTEAEYPTTVTEMNHHTAQYAGQVYQLEGVYTTTTINGVDTPYVYRTLVNGEEKTVCGLPMKYLEKDLADGSWIRVTAIINSGDFDGETCTVAEVVAVETLAEAGQAELQWSGDPHEQ